MEFCSTVLLSCVGKLAESLSRQRHLRAMRPNRIVFVNENHDAHIMWSSTRSKTSEPCDRLESHRLRQRESRCISGHRQDPKRACQIVKVIRSSLAVTCYSGARENMTLHVFFFSALKHYYHEKEKEPTTPREKKNSKTSQTTPKNNHTSKNKELGILKTASNTTRKNTESTILFQSITHHNSTQNNSPFLR
jgi:hypothetical protein